MIKFKNRIKKIGAGIMASLCAVSLFSTSIGGTLSASAAMTTENTALLANNILLIIILNCSVFYKVWITGSNTNYILYQRLHLQAFFIALTIPNGT